MRTQFDAVPSTEDSFDVADHGEVTATTTRLIGALIGKELRLNNSAWPGYEDDGDTSPIAIDAVALDLPWLNGSAPALIVRTVEDGFYYAFRPEQLWLRLGGAATLQAMHDTAQVLAYLLRRVWLDSMSGVVAVAKFHPSTVAR